MKKLLITTAIVAAASAGISTSASAALASNAVLDFDAGVAGGNYGFIVSGSYFAMDNNSDDIFKTNERTAISTANGLELGTTQNAATIDNTWVFFSNNGVHQTTSDTTVSNAVANTADIDFSGWEVFWNNVHINMGAGASNGVASIVCDVDCAIGDGFSLDYFATVPDDGATNFGNVNYTLHLEGTIGGEVSAVPVPAAVWLFGTGLLGLVGVARRKAA